MIETLYPIKLRHGGLHIQAMNIQETLKAHLYTEITFNNKLNLS